MSVTITVNEVAGFEHNIAIDGSYSYKRRFEAHVTGDDYANYVGPIAIRQALLDQYGIATGVSYQNDSDTYADWYESDPLAFVTDITCRQSQDEPSVWEIVVTYGEIDPEDWSENPLLRRPTRRFEEANTQEVADVAWNESESDWTKPVVNSAYDYFDPPVLKDLTRPVYVIHRNEAQADPFGIGYAVFDPLLVNTYRDSINSGTFLGFPARTVKCRSIKAEEVWSAKIPPSGAYYWSVTYLFEVNPRGWVARPLDQGLRKLSSDGTAREQITIDGSLATSPVLLDGQGDVLPPDGTPFYHEYLIYQERDFSAFGFPASWG